MVCSSIDSPLEIVVRLADPVVVVVVFDKDDEDVVASRRRGSFVDAGDDDKDRSNALLGKPTILVGSLPLVQRRFNAPLKHSIAGIIVSPRWKVCRKVCKRYVVGSSV